jgi:hypothetical protein
MLALEGSLQGTRGVFCHHCGQQLPGTARFCANCGAAFVAPPVAPREFVPPAVTARRKKTGLWLALSGIAILLLGAAAFVVLQFAAPVLRDLGVALPGSGASGKAFLREGSNGIASAILSARSGDEREAALSSDQRLIRDVFGRPPAFRVVFGTDPVSQAPTRVETWIYPRHAANFVFRDGKYADSGDTPRATALLRAGTARPEQFSEGLTLEQIRKLHKHEPLFQIDVPRKGGTLTAVHFETGLVATFDQASGRLCFVEQLAERSKK